jgi:hypothetical protein
VRVANRNGGRGINVGDNPQMTNPLWEALRDRQAAFAGIFAWGTDTFTWATVRTREMYMVCG